MDGILLHLRLLLVDREVIAVDDGGAPGLTVLLGHGTELIHQDLLHPAGIIQRILQIGDLILEGGGLIDPL